MKRPGMNRFDWIEVYLAVLLCAVAFIVAATGILF